MKNISIKKSICRIIFIILFSIDSFCNAQNQNSITLSASETGNTSLHTACQYVKLLPGYQYDAALNEYMYSHIDNSNMCDVTYLSGGAGFTGNNPPPLDNSLAVGIINGSFNVDPNGAATYTIPLVIPPGTMGMAPNLSLHYNSQGGNGSLGTGWSLGGLSAITRVTENYYNDGLTSPVSLTNYDRFLLDGDRLILVPPALTSAYGQDGTIYHTENESFKLITSHGSTGGGPDYFTVLDKDGTTYEYGNTTDSKILAGSAVLTWLLDKVTDNRGNYMTIQYFNDNNGNFYPTSIQYTGNANSNPVNTPYNKITFSYAFRGDPQTSYVAGYQENQNVLMTGIQMYAQNTLVHHYQLDYSIDQLYSHLVEITEYGSDGSSYNSTKINYHNNLNQIVTETPTDFAEDAYFTNDYPNEEGILPRFLQCGDFSGNGLTSVIEEEPTSMYGLPPNYLVGINWDLWSSAMNGPSNSTLGNFYSTATGSNGNARCGYLNGVGVSYIDQDGDPVNTDPEYGFSLAIPPLDINGDGKDDMVLYSNLPIPYPYISEDQFSVFLSNGNSFNSAPSYTFTGILNEPTPFIPLEGDFDGDGVDDLVIFYPISNDLFMYSVKNGVPTTLHWNLWHSIFNAYDSSVFNENAQVQVGAYAIDINGDGRKELLITANYFTYVVELNCDGSPTLLHNEIYPNFGIDPGVYSDITFSGSNPPNPNIAPCSATVYPGDFNGDGKTDLLIYNNKGGVGGNNWYISYSNGTDFGPFEPATFMAENGSAFGYLFSPTYSTHQYFVADFNGDGKDDIIDQGWSGYAGTIGVYGISYNAYQTMSMDVYFGNGNATAGNAAFIHATTYTLTVNDLGPQNQTIIGDFNGDGHQDMIVYNATIGASKLFTFDLNSQPDNGINKAIAISNGLNATTNIYYNNLPGMADQSDPNNYTEGNSAVFPVQDVQWPIYVTDHTEQDNGNGSQNEVDYTYSGALNHVQGKGFLGFTSQESYDYTTGLGTLNTYQYTNIYYDQLPLSTTSLYCNSYYSSLLSHYYTPIDTKTYTYTPIDNPTNILTPIYELTTCSPTGNYFYNIHYNYPSQVTDVNDLYGLSTTTTINQDLYGNTLTEIGNNAAETYTTTTTYTTEPNVGWNGQFPVCMATYTSTVTRPSQTPYTRYSSYLYNIYGQPTEKIDDIGLLTYYNYDDAGANVGNLVNTIISGGVAPRTYSYIYDYPYRRFVKEQTNPFGQTTFATYDNAYGNTLTTTDLNGHVTKYAYDGFGRVTQMTLPTGEQVTANRLWDNVSGLTNSLFYTTVSALGEATQATYYDKLGKTLRNQKNGFDGTNINQDIIYYNNQLPETETEPYYTGNTPQYNTFSYDIFLRASTMVNAAGLNTNYSFNYGQPTYTVVTSGSSPTPTKTFTKTFDETGLTTQATDDGGNLNYVYASCGKVASIGLPGTSQQEQITYDAYGRTSQVSDPDLGITSYTYDELGEILNVTDPTSNYTQTYDLLGRMLTSNESITYETNTYTYDNMAYGIGMLGSVTGVTTTNVLNVPQTNTVTCTYAYDNFSRPQTKTENINAGGSISTAKQTIYAYDNLNRITQITYPDAFVVNQSYNNNGYLYNISSPGSGNIWTCTSMNNYDEITSAAQGDGGAVNKTYDNLGFVTYIHAVEPPGTVMGYTYTFNDQTGDPTSRSDGSNSESFTYDNLDRLTSVVNNATPANNITMSYNAGGTIGSKSDVGDFTYTATQPHALTTVISPTSIDPLDIQSTPSITVLPVTPPLPLPPNLYYTPFKKLSTITEGSSPSQYEMDYVYGPDHQRKVSYESFNGSNTKTIVYSDNYDNIFTTSPLGSYQVDYIYSPDGLVAMDVNNSLYYTHTDHLGSIINVYGAGGSTNYTQSFDAWGNYRDPNNWNYVASNTINATYTPPPWLIRGYTGHEHLQDFEVINMNGRAYDPLFAQVLSPDPGTQFPGFSQGFERYSYCMNNPLKYTDPSGYNIWDDIKHAILKLVGDKDIGRYTRNTSMGHSSEKTSTRNSSNTSQQSHSSGGSGNSGEENHSFISSSSEVGGGGNDEASYQRHQQAIVGDHNTVGGPKYPPYKYDPITGKNLPVHYVFEQLTPDIYENTILGLNRNPAWSKLTYNGGGSINGKTRYDALKGFDKCSEEGFSRDEFPYASTLEGGAGAQVMCVPNGQQKEQRLELSLFYRKMNAGDKFFVIPVAGNEDKLFQVQPLPQSQPFPSIPPILVPFLEGALAF